MILTEKKPPPNKLKLILRDWVWRGAEEESQHHRIMQVGRPLSEVSGPTSCPKQGQLWDQNRLLRAFSTWFLKSPGTEPTQAVLLPGPQRCIPLRLGAVSITCNISARRETATETTALF